MKACYVLRSKTTRKISRNKQYKDSVMILHLQSAMLEADHYFWMMNLISLRTAGAGINVHVFKGVLNDLFRANPEEFDS